MQRVAYLIVVQGHLVCRHVTMNGLQASQMTARRSQMQYGLPMNIPPSHLYTFRYQKLYDSAPTERDLNGTTETTSSEGKRAENNTPSSYSTKQGVMTIFIGQIRISPGLQQGINAFRVIVRRRQH